MENEQNELNKAKSDPLDPSMEHCYENLIVIDVGANLTNKKYSRDLSSVIQRAQEAGKN